MATLVGTWRNRVSAGTSWPSFSTLWQGEVESWICNFCLSVAAGETVYADPSLRSTSMLLGRQATYEQINRTVEPYQSVRQWHSSDWLPCSTPGIIGSVLGPTDQVSVKGDWVRQQVWSATSVNNNNDNNNNNNNRIQRRYSRFFTFASQRREPSPTRTRQWSGRSRVQITCNTSSAYHVQVSCYVPFGTKGQLSY